VVITHFCSPRYSTYLSKDGNEAILNKKANVADGIFHKGGCPLIQAASIWPDTILEASNFEAYQYLKPLHNGCKYNGGCLP
jgi:hypothetical protein